MLSLKKIYGIGFILIKNTYLKYFQHTNIQVHNITVYPFRGLPETKNFIHFFILRPIIALHDTLSKYSTSAVKCKQGPQVLTSLLNQ